MNKKVWIILGVAVVVIILGLAGLTKAGYIPNYLKVGFLNSTKNSAKECFVEQDCVNSKKCDGKIECVCCKNKCYQGLVDCR